MPYVISKSLQVGGLKMASWLKGSLAAGYRQYGDALEALDENSRFNRVGRHVSYSGSIQSEGFWLIPASKSENGIDDGDLLLANSRLMSPRKKGASAGLRLHNQHYVTPFFCGAS